jgi:hypothetical protein
MPSKLPPLEYPDRFAGATSVLTGASGGPITGSTSPIPAWEDVGLEDINDGGWTVDFGPLTRGHFLARHRRIAEVYGRLKRRR